ncbi:MAG: DUF4097 domain-containing protein [Gemmatimonadota bacterium]|nr:DUF4097 domain-containing protein [Gemmatimonadota bacterium]
MRGQALLSWVATLGTAASALVGSSAALPAQAPERFELRGERVAIYNLAGHATVEAGSGPAVVVEVRRGGADAARLRVERGPIGDAETLRIVYPDDRLVYRPDDAWRGRSTVRVRDDGTFNDWSRDRGRRSGREVEIRDAGPGLDAHADIRILVPRGRQIAVYLAVGRMDATGLAGDVLLDGGATAVTVARSSGTIRVDVGSGSVRSSDTEGELDVDTGSGSVDVTGHTGRMLRLDTGSGSVSLQGVRVEELNVDTGSGDVTGSNVTAKTVLVDTGSGSVDLAFAGPPGDLAVDTGSGDVTLGLPAGFGARVELETSSGGIELDFPLTMQRWERDHVVGTIGSGGGQMKIETGSGDIRLRRS